MWLCSTVALNFVCTGRLSAWCVACMGYDWFTPDITTAPNPPPPHTHRSAITQWEPRQPEPLLAWFDAWAPLLPRGACQTLLQGLVMPRIAAAVEGWDPTRETQPIHAWLHPWLPYLAPEMASVYPTIRCVRAFWLCGGGICQSCDALYKFRFMHSTFTHALTALRLSEFCSVLNDTPWLCAVWLQADVEFCPNGMRCVAAPQSC